MSESFYRQHRSFSKAQAAYDNMQPPEYWEEDDEIIDDEEPDFEAMLQNKSRED